MTWNYRIFEFTEKDWDGCGLAESRKGAPAYGIFETFYNEDGEICARCESPETLVFDSYCEDDPDPRRHFAAVLRRMLEDIEKPIVKEPFEYAKPDWREEE